MRIVLDTNVLISAVFFGGKPQKIIDAVMWEKLSAYATNEIITEYVEVVSEMIARKQGHLRHGLLNPFLAKLHIIDTYTQVSFCRDPDDDKFLSCAIDASVPYIVSGDKDLLTIEEYKDIKIVTAAEFCDLLKL